MFCVKVRNLWIADFESFDHRFIKGFSSVLYCMYQTLTMNNMEGFSLDASFRRESCKKKKKTTFGTRTAFCSFNLTSINIGIFTLVQSDVPKYKIKYPKCFLSIHTSSHVHKVSSHKHIKAFSLLLCGSWCLFIYTQTFTKWLLRIRCGTAVPASGLCLSGESCRAGEPGV